MQTGGKYTKRIMTTKIKTRDFPGGPVGKTPRFQGRGLGSIPTRGTRSHMRAATKSPHATTKDPACCN